MPGSTPSQTQATQIAVLRQRMDVYERERAEDCARHAKEREEDRKAFAELLAEVKGIRDDQRTATLNWAHGCTPDNCKMPEKLGNVEVRVTGLESLVSQGRASWKTLGVIGGVAGGIVLFIQWIVVNVLPRIMSHTGGIP